MKPILCLWAILALGILTIPSQAQVIFNPDFSSGLPSGYTLVNNNVSSPPDSMAYSGSSVTAGDFSVVGPYDPNYYGTGNGGYEHNVNYVTSTSAAGPASNSVNVSFSFTPSFTYTPNGGGQGNIEMFAVTTANANNTPLFSVTLSPFNYTGSDLINLNAGIQYGQNVTQTGNTQFNAGAIGSTSGQTYTVNDVMTTLAS